MLVVEIFDGSRTADEHSDGRGQGMEEGILTECDTLTAHATFGSCTTFKEALCHCCTPLC